PFHAKIRELGNVHKPIFTWENFDERAEILRRDYASLIRLPDLDFARHATYDFLRACHAFAAGGVNVYGSIVLNVNFSAGFRDNALNDFAAGPDEGSDFLGINFDCLDPWRVLGQFRSRLVQCAAHDVENLRARFFRALDRFCHDPMADTSELQIELKTGDARIRSAELEVHIAKMILGADDVGQQFIAFLA